MRKELSHNILHVVFQNKKDLGFSLVFLFSGEFKNSIHSPWRKQNQKSSS